MIKGGGKFEFTGRAAGNHTCDGYARQPQDSLPLDGACRQVILLVWQSPGFTEMEILISPAIYAGNGLIKPFRLFVLKIQKCGYMETEWT